MNTHIFGINAYSLFGFLAALYLVGWVSYVFWNNKVSPRYLLFASLLSIVAFFVGSRLLFGILYLDHIIQNPSLLFESKLSNFTLYGGLITTFFTLKFSTEGQFLCAKKKVVEAHQCKVNFLKLSDIIAPHVGISVAIMRFGCFFNGCCFGKPTALPWGMYFARADSHPLVQMLGSNFITQALFNVDPVLRHPTQLYEMSAALLASFVAWLIGRKHKADGMVTFIFAWMFTFGRLVVFFFRDFPAATLASDLVRGPIVYGLCLVYITFWIVKIIKQKNLK